VNEEGSLHGAEGDGSSLESETSGTAGAAGLAASANEQQQLGGFLAPMLPEALLGATGCSSATFKARPLFSLRGGQKLPYI